MRDENITDQHVTDASLILINQVLLIRSDGYHGTSLPRGPLTSHITHGNPNVTQLKTFSHTGNK